MKLSTQFQLLTALFTLSLGGASSAHSVDLSTIAPELGVRTDADGDCLKTKKEMRDALVSILPRTFSDDFSQDLACLALKKHLGHDFSSDRSLPRWSEILNNKQYGTKTIRGKMVFLAVDPRPYQYTLKHDPKNGYEVEVKIYIKKFKLWNGSDLVRYPESERMYYLTRRFDLILADASQFWSNNHANVHFRFTRTENKDDADYSINVKQSPGGSLYDRFIDWWPNQRPKTDDADIRDDGDYALDLMTVEHEIGHMMGLEDEYHLSRSMLSIATHWTKSLQSRTPEEKALDNTIADVKNNGCDVSSIMCQGQESPAIKDYQLYSILRRWID